MNWTRNLVDNRPPLGFGNSIEDEKQRFRKAMFKNVRDQGTFNFKLIPRRQDI